MPDVNVALVQVLAFALSTLVLIRLGQAVWAHERAFGTKVAGWAEARRDRAARVAEFMAQTRRRSA